MLELRFPPLQGEGWGGDGFRLCRTARAKPIPLLASPLKGEEQPFAAHE